MDRAGRRQRAAAAADRRQGGREARPRGARTAGGSPSRAKRDDDEVAQVYVLDVAGGRRGAARLVVAARRARAALEPGRPAGSPTRARSTRARPTSSRTASWPPRARTRSRRSAPTRRSPSAAGTSGSTRRRRTSSRVAADGSGDGARPARRDEARRRARLRRRRRRGLGRRPAAGVVARRPLAGDRGEHEPQRRRARADEHPPLPAAARRRRARRAHDGPGELRLAALLAGRPDAVLPRGRGVGAHLRARPARLRRLAVDRPGQGDQRRLRPLRRRLRVRARLAHGLPHRRGRRASCASTPSPARRRRRSRPCSRAAARSRSIDSPKRAAAPVIVASWGSATEPAEIVRVDPAARTKTRLTSFDVEAAAALPWTAARGVLVHEREGPPRAQLPRAAARLRPGAEVPAAGADPRRPREHVARLDHAALELPPAREPRLRRAADRLPRLDGLRRGVHPRHPRRPAARAGRRREPGRRRGDPALPVHRRHAAGGRRRELRRSPRELARGHDARATAA